MANELDIDEEYERIFGKETHETLFGPDDADYQSLRQYILDSKREFNVKESLPFEDVTLLSYTGIPDKLK